MMNISFALTTNQVRHGFRTGEIQKDVTRRLGWRNAKPGWQLCACEKCQGLGKGGKLVRLGVIELVTVGLERLDMMTTDLEYGRLEVLREGFPEMTPAKFVEMFCKHNGCEPHEIITRLEFRYIITPVRRMPLTALEAKACCTCQHWKRIDETCGKCLSASLPIRTGEYATCPSYLHARENDE